MLPTPICDAGDPTSTIESCDILIREYKEYLSLRELDIRKKNALDPERSKAMREYAELEEKLDKTIENKAKIQSKIGSNKSVPKSSFRWLGPNNRGIAPFDGASYTNYQRNWSGTAAAVQTTYAFGHIYRVTGTFVVPTAQIPPGSRCTGSGYTQFRSSAWVGIGGDTNTKYIAYEPGFPEAYSNTTLYQAGVTFGYDCETQSTVYFPWTEDWPMQSKEVPVTDTGTPEGTILPISLGDIVQIVVSYPAGDYGTVGSTMHASFNVQSTVHINWNKLVSVTDSSNYAPGLTAEAVVERGCWSAAKDSAGRPYCPVDTQPVDWFSPFAYPQSANSGIFIFTDLKYSASGVTPEINLNAPYSAPLCQNVVQNAPNQCTANVIYSLDMNSCDGQSAAASSDTSTTSTYILGVDLPNGDNGLCDF